MSDNRIIKNTLFLYFRMFITLVVSLYTSRVVLDTLGAEDYGIYGIAGSIVVLFSFLSNAMTGASQRFFSYELGKKNSSSILKQTFSVSLVSHILVAILIIILCESIGLWYFKNKLVIPENRYYAAYIVYQLSVITFVFSVVRIPFNASIISHEEMDFFAYLSIIEVGLKLLVAYLLQESNYDKLILYAFMMLVVTFLCTAAYVVYSLIRFDECSLKVSWNFSIFRHMMSYTGWSFCVNMANVTSQQGGNIILNNFFGVLLNAAYSLASQVSGVIYSFVTSFQMAFRPQIVKLYASGQYSDLWTLVFRSSRTSFYLLLMIAVPCISNIEFVFSLWLKQVPEYSVNFCTLIILYCLIDAIQAPLWMVIEATGRIKIYSLWLTAVLVINLPLSYIILKYGGSPSTFLIVRVVINAITAIIRTLYMKYFISFPVACYFKEVLKCLAIFILSLGISYAMGICTENIIYYKICSILFSFTITGSLIGIFGLSRDERDSVIRLFKNNGL